MGRFILCLHTFWSRNQYIKSSSLMNDTNHRYNEEYPQCMLLKGNNLFPMSMLKGRLYIPKGTGMLLCNLEDQSLVSAPCGMLCSLYSLLKYLGFMS